MKNSTDHPCTCSRICWDTNICAHLHLFPIFKAILDNGPARKMNNAQEIQAAGDQWADPFEISTLRRDVRALYNTKLSSFISEHANYEKITFIQQNEYRDFCHLKRF